MDKKYIRKEIMSNCEQDFYKIFNQYFGKDYTIQPQISLNSIIQKNI